MVDDLLRSFGKFCLWLRYRIRVRGLNEVAARGRRGILFLPNHPALIDPIMLMCVLHHPFRARALADPEQLDRFFVRWAGRRGRVIPIPDMAKHGFAARAQVETAIARCVEALRAGDNLLLYPSGHISRRRTEELRGNSAVERILREVPDVRVVLIRTTGLWGSMFSRAPGRLPNLAAVMRKAMRLLLVGGLFFVPKRRVDIKLFEPVDFPRGATRRELNRYIEDFYNKVAPPNTYVPYTLFEPGGVRTLGEPDVGAAAGDLKAVPPSTRRAILAHLRERCGGETLRDEHHLADDLGMDSLARAELLVWLQKEFTYTRADAESLQSVGDVLLAAAGQGVSAGEIELHRVPRRWFANRSEEPVQCADGQTIPEAFLTQAARAPSKAIIADQLSGVKTYRDLVTACFALRPMLARLGGDHLGILLPASVAATTTYLAAMFAGKTPVMVNWTVGRRNIDHALELTGARAVVTSRRFVAALTAQGTDLAFLSKKFVHLEDLAGGISRWSKLRAAAGARLSWESLRRSSVSPTAAVLFTSGSESLPKAVPLTHANILANVRDVLRAVRLRSDDRMMAILPPFHAFGLTGNVVAPLVASIQAAYHPNPTEGWAIGRLIREYGASIIIGTPTFLGGIARASKPEALATLRLAITGAESCSPSVYDLLNRRCPRAVILEGYGATECSPIITLNDERDPRQGAIGRPLPSLACVVVDVECRRRIGEGETGMLLVSGPSVFDGYLGYDGPSPFVEFENRRWYRTGDLVSRDADGVLTFRGRLKRFAKIGGEMVSLPAIEAVLADDYPPAEDGTPSLGVVASEGRDRCELVLFTTCRTDRRTVNRRLRCAGLSPLHNVARVEHVDALPLLGTGKVDYRALSAML